MHRVSLVTLKKQLVCQLGLAHNMHTVLYYIVQSNAIDCMFSAIAVSAHTGGCITCITLINQTYTYDNPLSERCINANYRVYYPH